MNEGFKPEKIGKFISEMRRKKNLTQEEFAEKLHINSRTISRWETGRSMPDISMFPLISNILSISINDLMSGEIIAKENYDETFAENIVKMATNRKKSKLSIVFGCIYIISIVCIILFICYIKLPFKQEYNAKIMEISLDGSYLKLNTSYNGFPKVLIRKNNNETLIFIRFESTLSQMREKSSDNIDTLDYIDLTESNLKYDFFLTKIPKDKYKVYYTNVKFSKIVTSNEQNLNDIINKSNLMYEIN